MPSPPSPIPPPPPLTPPITTATCNISLTNHLQSVILLGLGLRLSKYPPHIKMKCSLRELFQHSRRIYIYLLCYRPSLEKGSDQMIVTLYTYSINLFLCSQTADPNPFRGTHCSFYTDVIIFF